MERRVVRRRLAVREFITILEKAGFKTIPALTGGPMNHAPRILEAGNLSRCYYAHVGQEDRAVEEKEVKEVLGDIYMALSVKYPDLCVKAMQAIRDEVWGVDESKVIVLTK